MSTQPALGAPPVTGAPSSEGHPPAAGTAPIRKLTEADRVPLPGPASGPRLSLIRHDGQPSQIFPIGRGIICGRSQGEALLPDDPTVSPSHARFTVQGGRVSVEDLGSLSGTFVRLRTPISLILGDEIRIGRQLLRLELFPRNTPPPAEPVAWGSPDKGYELRLVQLLDGGGTGEVFPLKADENQVGRDHGDIVFPFDRYVSGRHARFDLREGQITLTDLGSSNGTFVRVNQPTVLQGGDQLLIGLQLLRLDT